MKNPKRIGRTFQAQISGSLDDYPQTNVPHPDAGYRVCGWKLPIGILKASAFASPKELGITEHATSRLRAYEELNKKACAMGFKNVSHALCVMEAALAEARGK
jgi:hypothetical protein